MDIPYITPAVCIVLLLKQWGITLPEALEKLKSLRPFISSDEYNTVKWALEIQGGRHEDTIDQNPR